MKTATTTIVNKTAAQVQAHNESPLVTNGLEAEWVQSESAKQDEIKQAARQAKEATEIALYKTAKETVLKLNAEMAAKHGMPVQNPNTVMYYAPGSSAWRTGPFAGITVEFGYDKRRTYKFNKDNVIGTHALSKMLDEHYEIAANVAARKAIEDAKKAAAAEVVSPALRRAIAATAGKAVSELTTKLQDDGKIAISYIYYPGWDGNRRRESYPVNVFTPCSVAQWEQWVAIQSAHKAALTALTAEIKG